VALAQGSAGTQVTADGSRQALQEPRSEGSSKVQRKCATFMCMKTATIPSVRVEPELRAELESLLAEGQTVSEFVEASVRAAVQRARDQSEFLTRGLQSLEDARLTCDYADAERVVQKLQKKLDAARKRKPAAAR
jgi:hypothetical protein